jgi:hypothetical protein
MVSPTRQSRFSRLLFANNTHGKLQVTPELRRPPGKIESAADWNHRNTPETSKSPTFSPRQRIVFCSCTYRRCWPVSLCNFDLFSLIWRRSVQWIMLSVCTNPFSAGWCWRCRMYATHLTVGKIRCRCWNAILLKLRAVFAHLLCPLLTWRNPLFLPKCTDKKNLKAVSAIVLVVRRYRRIWVMAADIKPSSFIQTVIGGNVSWKKTSGWLHFFLKKDSNLDDSLGLVVCQGEWILKFNGSFSMSVNLRQ